jgi:hypothetical protein
MATELPIWTILALSWASIPLRWDTKGHGPSLTDRRARCGMIEFPKPDASGAAYLSPHLWRLRDLPGLGVEFAKSVGGAKAEGKRGRYLTVIPAFPNGRSSAPYIANVYTCEGEARV